jgi:hypothetical protein
MRTRLKHTVIKATATAAAAAADDDERKRWRDSSNRDTKEYFLIFTDIAFLSSMHTRLKCLIRREE